MDATMTSALRKVMAEFIRVDGRSITIHRPEFSRTATGGYAKGNYTQLPPQIFRLVMYKRRLTDLTTSKAEGEIPVLPYVLVGYYNSNIQRMDEFSLDGVFYRVQGIEPHTAVETYTDRKVSQLIALDGEKVSWA